MLVEASGYFSLHLGFESCEVKFGTEFTETGEF
jgi:hypothetical protein